MRIKDGLVLAGLLLSLPLAAGPIIPLSIENLTDQAQLVARGSVLSKTCLRDEAGRICTRLDFEVKEVWKGNLSTNRLTLVHSGGILGQEGLKAYGQVDYRVGEEAVVFLILNQRGEGVSIGMCQGKFELWKDPDTGRTRVANPFHGRPATPAAGQTKKAAVGGDELTVEMLKQKVQGARQ